MGENFCILVKKIFSWRKRELPQKLEIPKSFLPQKFFFRYPACCPPGNNSSLILYTPVHSGPVVTMLGDKRTQLGAHESDYQLLFHVQALGCINNGVVAVVCHSAPMSTVVAQFSLCGVFYLRSCR